MTAPARRLGLFGGSFDPPHRAHRVLAEAAAAQLRLDELRICPTGDAWHKSRALTDGVHRLAMARLAFGSVPQAVVDDRELRRQGPSYTVDTLRELAAEQPGAELFLLIGEDQAAGFTRWHAWEEVARLATIVVAQRAGIDAGSLPPGVRTTAITLVPLPDSATEVRRRLTAGEAITELVAPAVARYIEQHRLYRTTP